MSRSDHGLIRSMFGGWSGLMFRPGKKRREERKTESVLGFKLDFRLNQKGFSRCGSDRVFLTKRYTPNFSQHTSMCGAIHCTLALTVWWRLAVDICNVKEEEEKEGGYTLSTQSWHKWNWKWGSQIQHRK